jgi:hypothetical protein
MGSATDAPDATRPAIVHGRALVTDELGRLLLSRHGRVGKPFAQALGAHTLDLVVVVPRTPDQIDDIVRMNGLGGGSEVSRQWLYGHPHFASRSNSYAAAREAPLRVSDPAKRRCSSGCVAS